MALPLSGSLSLSLPALPRPAPPLPGSFGFSSDVFIMDTIGGGEVSLGDLADLTVTNDNDLSCDVSSQGAPPPAGPGQVSRAVGDLLGSDGVRLRSAPPP